MCCHPGVYPPPPPQGARGVDGDLIILDEAAFIPEGFIQKVVWPMAQKRGVVVLGISTSGGPTNYYTKLREMMSNAGTPLFRFITISRICKKCQESDHPEKCMHNLHLMPPWKSLDRFKLCEKLLTSSKNTIMREVLGLMDRESGGAFSLKDIDALKEARPLFRPRGRDDPEPLGPTMELPDLLFISVDPGPGSSETAMVAGCYNNKLNKVVVRACMLVGWL